MASVTLRAFAKINLSLRVSSARPDGFHDVRTILQAHRPVRSREVRGAARSVRDSLRHAGRADRSHEPRVEGARSCCGTRRGAAATPRDAVVTLQKNIPMKAGLGGGSSDAAAALLGLRRLWKLRVPDEQIHAMAATLGSDVPFFLVGGTALGLGRGDEVYPLESLPRYSVVLVIPPFGVATNDAYEWFDETRLDRRACRIWPETWLGRTTSAGQTIWRRR